MGYHILMGQLRRYLQYTIRRFAPVSGIRFWVSSLRRPRDRGPLTNDGSLRVYPHGPLEQLAAFPHVEPQARVQMKS